MTDPLYATKNFVHQLVDRKVPRRVILESDVSNDTTTMADVTGLSFPVTAGKRYFFRFFVRFTKDDPATGSQWGINAPPLPTELAFRRITEETT